MPTITLPNSAAAAETRGPTIIWSAILMMSVMTVFVFLRILSRRVTRTSLWWDDWFCMAAYVPAMMTAVGCIVGVQYHGYGKHTILQADTIPQMHKFLIDQYIVELSYVWAIALVRASLIFLYQRIFPSRITSRWFKYATYVLHALNVAWLSWCFFAVVFTCSPVSGFWNFETNPQCLDEHLIFLISAFQNFALDFLTLALPVVMIRSLQLNNLQKLAVLGTFCIGIVATVGGVLRVNTIIHEDLHQDPTWILVDTGIWTYVETSLGIVCACVPSLRPLLRWLSGKGFTLSSGSRSRSDSSLGSRIARCSCFKDGEKGSRAAPSSQTSQGSKGHRYWWSSQKSAQVNNSSDPQLLPSADHSDLDSGAHGLAQLVPSAEQFHYPRAKYPFPATTPFPVADSSPMATSPPVPATYPLAAPIHGQEDASNRQIHVQREYAVDSEDGGSRRWRR